MSDYMSSLIDMIFQFFNTYYLDPIRNDSGYNPVNTITWAIVLGISLLGLTKLFDKLQIKITPRFIASVMTFVLAGSSLRVIEDAHLGIINPPISYLLITPNIYFLVFAITVICLWISIQLQRAGIVKDFHFIFAGFGLLWFFLNLIILLHFEHIVCLRPFICNCSGVRTNFCILPDCTQFEFPDVYKSSEPLHLDDSSDGCFSYDI